MKNNRTNFCRTKGNMLVAFCLFLFVVLTSFGAYAQPAMHAVLSQDKTTLTFYYLQETELANYKGNGTDYLVENSSNPPAYNSAIKNVTKIVFHSSFASARPTSCAYWFSNFENLTFEIGGKILPSLVFKKSRMSFL